MRLTLMMLSKLALTLAFLMSITAVPARSSYLQTPISYTRMKENAPNPYGEGSSCLGHGAGGWAFSAVVSSDDGLVVQNVHLGPRLLAREMSVPYFEIRALWGLTGYPAMLRGRLTPRDGLTHSDAEHQLLTTTLVHFLCRPNGAESIGVEATYAVNGLPEGMTMWVNQSYRFDRSQPNDRCEASGKLPCSRFWPTVTWGADHTDDDGLLLISDVRIIQRFEFDPDTVPGADDNGRGNIYRDRTLRGGFEPRQGVETLGSNGSMKYEDRVPAISKGQRVQDATWDSWHQTNRMETSDPGVNLLDPHPGCSECVHAHWSWGGALTLMSQLDKYHVPELNVFGIPVIPALRDAAAALDAAKAVNPFSGFTDGRPAILAGSKQTTYIAVVRYSSVENKELWQNGYGVLLNSKKSTESELRDSRPVIFWDMNTPREGFPPDGVMIDGRRFPIGDAAWPQLEDKIHGGNGSMFFAPARVLAYSSKIKIPDPSFSIVPEWQSEKAVHLEKELHPRLPAGWILPVAVNRCQADTEKGPFWISVDLAPGQHLLNADMLVSGAPNSTRYYIPLYKDTFTVGSSPQFTGGDVVEQITCPAESGEGSYHLYGQGSYHSYLVLAEKPNRENVFGMELLGAPDGDEHFVPYEEPHSSEPGPLKLPTTPLGEECPAPPSKHLVGIPDDTTHLCVVNAQLDGNGNVDQLLLWTSGTTRGAVANLDHGAQVSLTPGLLQTSPPDYNPFYAVDVRDINGDGRDDVIVLVISGANTFHHYILTLEAERELSVVSYPGGAVTEVYTGGGASSRSGWGCVTVTGQHLLASTSYYTDWSKNARGTAFYWGAVFLQLDGATARPVGWQGGYAPDEQSAWRQISGWTNFCKSAPPDLGSLRPKAQTPAEAVTSLLDAALQGNQAAGATYLAGYFTDSNPPADYDGGVWVYLTDRYRDLLLGWQDRPVTCDPIITKDGHGQETYCHIVSANGYSLDTLIIQIPPEYGAGWTVSTAWIYVPGQ